MPHDFIVAIPARHDATRLPGKPLRLLAGNRVAAWRAGMATMKSCGMTSG